MPLKKNWNKLNDRYSLCDCERVRCKNRKLCDYAPSVYITMCDTIHKLEVISEIERSEYLESGVPVDKIIELYYDNMKYLTVNKCYNYLVRFSLQSK